MTTATQACRSRTMTTNVPAVIGAGIAVVLSEFGLALPWLAFVLVAIVGLALRMNRVLLLVAAGIAAGALLYIGLALAMNLFDSPSSGSGSGALGTR